MFCPFPGTLRRLFFHAAKSCWVPGHSWSRAQGGFHLIHGTHSHCKLHSMCISLLHSSAHAPGLHGLACLKGTRHTPPGLPIYQGARFTSHLLL